MKQLLFAFSISIIFFSCKKDGCTDSTATNYDSDAKKDDGSCTYSNSSTTATTITSSGGGGTGSSSVVYGNNVTDIDGNVYKTVIIGNQEWMAENIRTRKYKNGNYIQTATAGNWRNLKSGAYSYYNNDSLNTAKPYGALYNWYAVNTKKLCPTGWHVPTDDNWTELTDYLDSISPGGQQDLVLKSTTGWSNSSGIDDYGWNALPTGSRSRSGSYTPSDSTHTTWWSATQLTSTASYRRTLTPESPNLERGTNEMRYGFSVRCLKD